MGSDSARAISRRDLLRAMALGSAAVGLAACGAPLSSPTPSPAASPSNSPRPTPSRIPSPSATPQVAPSATPAASPTPPPVAGLSLRQKIGQVLLVGFSGQKAAGTSAVARAIASGELGGVILFDRNIVSPGQLADLTGGLSALAPKAWPLLVAVDQEGGRVQRLGPAHGFPNIPSQEVVGTHRLSYGAAIYRDMAETLAAAGITLNLAPVVDINVNPRNPAVGALDRSFSADPDMVTDLARASIEAHRKHAVFTTLKHFPGLGSASANTDFAVVDVTKTWTEAELTPYRDLVDEADCVMVGHIINATLDTGIPSSLSKATVDGLLRTQIGWRGPVVSDDLQAVAITRRYKRTDAIAGALNAGVDLLLFAAPTGGGTFYSDLVDSVETLVASGKVSEERINEAATRVALLRGRA